MNNETKIFESSVTSSIVWKCEITPDGKYLNNLQNLDGSKLTSPSFDKHLPWIKKLSRDKEFKTVLKQQDVPKDEIDVLLLNAKSNLEEQMEGEGITILTLMEEETKSIEEKRLDLLKQSNYIKTELLHINTDPTTLFSCSGNHYIKFRKPILKEKDGETRMLFKPSKLMNLNFKNGMPTEIEVFMKELLTKLYPPFPPSRQDVQEIISALLVDSYNNPQETVNRIAYRENAIYYDMSDEYNNVVIVNKDEWTMIKETNEIIFKYEVHQAPQVEPIHGGDPWKMLKYIHVANKDDEKLMLIYVITCFLPHIDRVIVQLTGQSGCGKSASTKYMNLIVDPSVLESGQSLNKDATFEQIEQHGSHRYFAQYDNADPITKKISDLLNRFSTGYNGSERLLFFNNEELLYKFKCCVSLNGIEPVGTEIDFRSRAIEFHLNPITNNVDQETLRKQFEEDRPEIMGGIFDTLQKAMAIYDNVEETKFPPAVRMIGFARWGYAIAEALGIGGEKFIEIYLTKIKNRDIDSVEEDAIGNVLYQYMNAFTSNTTMGKPAELLEHLTKFKTNYNIKTEYWPVASNSFTRHLNKISKALEGVGIEVKRHGRNIIITNHNFNNEPVIPVSEDKHVVNVLKIKDFNITDSDIDIGM